jgi:hypothetical protein
MASTAAKDTAEAEQKQRGDAGKPKAAADGQSTKGIVSYWGIEPRHRAEMVLLQGEHCHSSTFAVSHACFYCVI